MRAQKRETDYAMVELRRIPMNQSKGAAVMFIVATLALLVVGLGVEAFPGGDAGVQRGMAGEAFGGADPTPRVVTLEAMGCSLQLRVRLAQRAR